MFTAIHIVAFVAQQGRTNSSISVLMIQEYRVKISKYVQSIVFKLWAMNGTKGYDRKSKVKTLNELLICYTHTHIKSVQQTIDADTYNVIFISRNTQCMYGMYTGYVYTIIYYICTYRYDCVGVSACHVTTCSRSPATVLYDIMVRGGM